MSQVLSRIILAIVFVASIPVLWVTCFLFIERGLFRADTKAMLATAGVCGLGVIVGWVLLWRRHVRWNAARTRRTLYVLVLAIVVGTALGFGIEASVGRRTGPVLGPAFGALLWLAGTALAWRETDAERATRPAARIRGPLHCPKCGYNMTGLYDARCPECGTQYTLDQIMTSVMERNEVGTDE